MDYTEQYQQILSEHGKALSRVAASYEAAPHLQEDLLQEIGLAIWRALPRFRGDSSLKTFVLRIAHNQSITHVSKSVREPESEEWEEAHQYSPDRPDREFENLEAQRRLMNAIRSLPLMERELVTLALEGLSYQEIAEILGINTNLVGVKLNRTRSKLTKFLESKQ